jgi:hypothetical protein
MRGSGEFFITTAAGVKAFAAALRCERLVGRPEAHSAHCVRWSRADWCSNGR